MSSVVKSSNRDEAVDLDLYSLARGTLEAPPAGGRPFKDWGLDLDPGETGLARHVSRRNSRVADWKKREKIQG